MILIVGGTGTIGSHLARALAHRSDVRALARNRERADQFERLGIQAVIGDLARPCTLGAVFEDVTKVFIATPRENQLDNEWNAIEAAERAGVERFVKVSLIHAGEPPVPYLRRPHDLLDARLASSSMSSTILRPPAFMTHLTSQIDQIADGRILFPAGNVCIALVDPRDVADVAIEALVGQRSLDTPLVVTGPRSLSFDEVANIIAEVLGRGVRYVDEAPLEWRKRTVAAGSPEWLADGLIEIYADYAGRGGVPASGVVESVLGRPARSVRQFTEEVLRPAMIDLMP